MAEMPAIQTPPAAPKVLRTSNLFDPWAYPSRIELRDEALERLNVHVPAQRNVCMATMTAAKACAKALIESLPPEVRGVEVKIECGSCGVAKQVMVLVIPHLQKQP